MRITVRAALAALLLALTAAAVGAASPATASPAPTIRVYVRPVTTTGHVVSGVSVSSVTGAVDCSVADPSPVAVNRNIEECAPDAAYAVACWKSASGVRALCMPNPVVPHLVSRPRGAFAPTPPVSATVLAPMVLVLTDGTQCTIRDGGAWNALQGHPGWAGDYTCNHHGAVWAPVTAPHNGVNETALSWRVQIAPASGVGPLTTWHVVKAYFVGSRAV